MQILADRVALVTGASSGIGRAVAVELARSGATVVGTCHRNGEGARETAAAAAAGGGTCRMLHCDLREPGQVDQLVDGVLGDLGQVDILVNNAGGPLRRGDFFACDEAVWDEAYRLNLRQVVQLTRRVLADSMLPRRSGSVVNISSVAARTASPGLGVHYASFKAALNILTLGLAREVAPHGVRVNAVAPGTIDTPLHQMSPPGHLERLAQRIPAGRVGQPDEVARVVRFLASDEAAFITGETLYVTGGY